MSARERIQELQARIGRSIVGQEHMVERLLIGLLANGNLLVEGLPGRSSRAPAYTPTTYGPSTRSSALAQSRLMIATSA